MSIKIDIINKYEILSKKKPISIDLTNIDPVKLFYEVQTINESGRLKKFGKIFNQLEGLKQFNSHFYVQKKDKLPSFRDAIFYNELVQIQVFYEFIKQFDDSNKNFSNLNKIIENKNNIRLNKIRNAISHFDWEVKNEFIIFRDTNFEKEISYEEVSEFSSLISIIAIFMTNNIDEID